MFNSEELQDARDNYTLNDVKKFGKIEDTYMAKKICQAYDVDLCPRCQGTGKMNSLVSSESGKKVHCDNCDGHGYL